MDDPASQERNRVKANRPQVPALSGATPMKHYAMQSADGKQYSMYAQSDEARAKRDASRKRTRTLSAFLLVIIMAASVIALYIGVTSCSEQVAERELAASEIHVTIPSGYGSGDIAQLLVQEGVITSTTQFLRVVSNYGAAGMLQAGKYTFEKDESYDSIVGKIMDGRTDEGIMLTIPEGFNLRQIAERASDAMGTFTVDEFLAQAKASYYILDYSFLSGVADDSLEGFLYPETYALQEDSTPDDIIRTMLNQFRTVTADYDWSTASQGSQQLSQYQVIIAASLIEKETAIPEERPLVASVIFNRLNVPMLLQIDAALNYGLNKWEPLTSEDLATPNPYNTYFYGGLPPTPICSPSASSILAVLNAPVTGYYYYVASPALDGTHVFAETAEQHEANANAYWQAAGLV